MNKKDRANILAKIVFERYATKYKIVLPTNYWNLPSYKKKYQLQLMKANQYMKVYDFDIIYKVLQDNPWVFSLNLKQLDLMIRDALDKQKVLNIQNKSKLVEPTQTKVNNLEQKRKSKFDE